MTGTFQSDTGGTSIPLLSDSEAEGLADIDLKADERGDDLYLSSVIDAIHCHQKVNSYHRNTNRV